VEPIRGMRRRSGRRGCQPRNRGITKASFGHGIERVQAQANKDGVARGVSAEGKALMAALRPFMRPQRR
jgi:hypothetical protein